MRRDLRRSSPGRAEGRGEERRRGVKRGEEDEINGCEMSLRCHTLLKCESQRVVEFRAGAGACANPENTEKLRK